MLSGCHININAIVAKFCFEEITMSTSCTSVFRKKIQGLGSWKVTAVQTERKLCISLGSLAEILHRAFLHFDLVTLPFQSVTDRLWLSFSGVFAL